MVRAGINAVSAALALLVSSVGHDAMHSVALRLVLSPSILPEVAQPRLDEVITCPQQYVIRLAHSGACSYTYMFIAGAGDVVSACMYTADAPHSLNQRVEFCSLLHVWSASKVCCIACRILRMLPLLRAQRTIAIRCWLMEACILSWLLEQQIQALPRHSCWRGHCYWHACWMPAMTTEHNLAWCVVLLTGEPR